MRSRDCGVNAVRGTLAAFMSAGPSGDRAAVFRHPDLRRYVSARFIAAVATQVQTVAVGWQVFVATGNPFDLGLVALSQFLPFIILILPAGHIADSFDRRRVQLITYMLPGASLGGAARRSRWPGSRTSRRSWA